MTLAETSTTHPEVVSEEHDRGRDAEAAHQLPLRGWKDILLRVKDEISEDHVTLAAAGVAFFGFLALVPLIATGVSVYGLIADPSQVTDVVDRIDDNVPAEVADFVDRQLRAVAGSSGGALGLGVLLSVAVSLWSASAGMSHLLEAVNIAYEEDVDGRPFWMKKLMAIGFTIGLLVLLAAMGLVLSLTRILGTTNPWWWQAVSWLLVAALMTCALAVLYRYAPDRTEARWRWVSVGAVFAVVAWAGASIGLRFYVSNFGSYNETYGSLATIVIVLLWLYVSALVVIVGAELDAEIEHQTLVDTTVDPEQPFGERGAVVADTVGEAR